MQILEDFNGRFWQQKFHCTFKTPSTFGSRGVLLFNKQKNNVLKNEVKKIFSLLHHFKDTENISPSDVIRYAKFAMITIFI